MCTYKTKSGTYTRPSLFLFLALFLMPSTIILASPKPFIAHKLYPQLTEGIVNASGQVVMNCQIADDGLTVTDKAWHSYKPGEGRAKRWSVNQSHYSQEPLINYSFDKSYSGLQVAIQIEIFNTENQYQVYETYQEILQLGGTPQLDLPEWFHVPQDRLSYDFEEGDWFPSGWSIPKGKYACWEGAAKYNQTDRNGRHPMLDFGFTHVAENTVSPGGHMPDWAHQCRVFGDAEWLDMSQGGNWKLWHNDGWKARGDRMEIVIPDFENGDHWKWNQDHFDAFERMVSDFKKEKPNCSIGCWGVGVVNHSLRIFDYMEANGRNTGVVDERSARQWADFYINRQPILNRIFRDTGLNFGNPSVYWLNGGNPGHLYGVIEEWEVGKLERPDVPNVISTWIQTEFVDNYPLSPYQFPKPDGTIITRYNKHQAPPSLVYALSLFAHCRMDGAYCWEVGTIYSEDAADAGGPDDGGMQKPVHKVINGVEKFVWYYIKYFGFYNYHVLGMYQASLNKDIIEADTQWVMPELKTSTGNTWRVGEKRFPSFCNLYKEPLIRAKLSAKGDELLVIACNPYNRGVQQVDVRMPETTESYHFELIGDYPVIKRFKVNNLPAAVSLVDSFKNFNLPAKSQGARPTCSIFAITAAASYEYAKFPGNKATPLSEEYLVWAANEATGLKGDQGMFYEIVYGLNRLGICEDNLMPYANKTDENRTPSKKAMTDAASRFCRWGVHWIKRWDMKNTLTNDQFYSLKQALANNHPVACGMRWPKNKKGSSILQVPDAKDVFDGHSIVLVGYQDDSTQPGGGVFTYRNSRGTNWGQDGYGQMSYAYVKAYANDLLWLNFEEVNSYLPIKRIEAETITVTMSNRCKTIIQSLGNTPEGLWSGGNHLFCKARKDGYIVLPFNIESKGCYKIGLRATAAPDYGIIRIELDGTVIEPDVDLYSGRVCPSGLLELGEIPLGKGVHTIKITAIDKNPASDGMYFGIDSIDLFSLN